MSSQYILEIEVPASAIDGLGHVNNVEYVRWMQDAATAHSDSLGCTAATRADGAMWVARRHAIEYLRPAFEGDRIEIRTWIDGSRRAFSSRRYEFHRPADGTLLAKAETEWVYVDAGTGRPRSIPEQVLSLFREPTVEPDRSHRPATP
jgi:acyl-CoA thioester hydrolase